MCHITSPEFSFDNLKVTSPVLRVGVDVPISTSVFGINQEGQSRCFIVPRLFLDVSLAVRFIKLLGTLTWMIFPCKVAVVNLLLPTTHHHRPSGVRSTSPLYTYSTSNDKTQIAIFKLRFCYLVPGRNENDTCRGRF